MNNVFGLDIGTRNVVGTVGHRTEDGAFIVEAQYVRQHETRSMLDGQIHDIGKVARTISAVKAELEAQLDAPLSEVCIAAAGRVLKTVTTHVEYEYAEESVVTGEDIHTLNLLGVEQAQDILREQNDTKYKFYCVGYSVVKYYLNEEVFISIEGHKANKIGEDIIVTFLPEDVVDGLYSAVGQAKMTVANMTLEPIAAINVAIPENFRMLNIALVDVGAGTSDISITREGSIIAYGMIPYAGDELTELIVQQYLVDFQTAEKMKLASSSEDEVTYEDIMSISHTIPSKEIWELVAPTVEKITSEVAAKIKELNGDKTVSACFVVGGGGKIHGFTEKLAGHLDLPTERVALRFPNDQLFPKRGMPINFTVNGGARIARGEAGEAAIVTMNGQPANINTPLEPNSDITIEPSTAGDNAVYTIGQLPEYHESVISFVINGQNVVCPKFVEVNGSLEPDSYEIQEGDSIETRNFYTVAQIAEFMDVEIDPDSEILVNNREAGMETLVYENFSIDWTPLSFGVASESENRYNATEGVTDSAEISQEEMTPETSGETKAAESEKKDTVCVVTVNGETVELTGKEDYIFVDVFDRITFDLNAGNGRAIATLVNGMEAEFSQPLNNGDRVEIYWKEK